MSNMPTSIAQRTIDQGPMTRFQIAAVGICMAMNLIDGFDVLAISFAAPLLAEDWSLTQDQLGLLFSAGLAGMTVGSALVAPLADRLGRRWMTLFSLVLVTVGMMASALAASHLQMVVLRFVTGLGIGAMLPSINTVVAEYASAKRRELAICVMSTGYPIGATLGGTAALFIIAAFGWRGIFVFGAVLSALMIPAVIWRLPESLEFLVSKRPPGALAKANHLLERLGHEALTELPQPAVHQREPGLKDVVVGGLWQRTLLLWIAFFCVMFTFYFVLNWTPKLLVDAGLPTDQGISGGVLLNVGGIVGALSLGLSTTRVNVFKMHGLALIATALTMMVFGISSGMLEFAMALALVVGFFLFACMVGLYAITPSLYPAPVRNTGTGLAIGFGRCGAVLSPYLAGLLLEQGMAPDNAYITFGLPMLVAAIAVFFLHRRSRAAAPDVGAATEMRP